MILNRNPIKAGKALLNIMRKRISKEVRNYMKAGSQWMGDITGIDSILSFKWSNVLEEAADKIPTLCAALQGAMCVKENGQGKVKGARR